MAAADSELTTEALLGCSEQLPQLVGHDVPGQVLKAGRSSRRYQRP
jgi:hydroxymethylglutaryl-CoA lyase